MATPYNAINYHSLNQYQSNYYMYITTIETGLLAHALMGSIAELCALKCLSPTQ